MKQRITNPIFNEFLKYKIIKNDLSILAGKTRDKNNLKVYKDNKSGVIFLEKYVRNLNYYSKINYKDDQKILKNFNDYKRRFEMFKYFLRKNILDYGCGWGEFLSLIKNLKLKYGVELRLKCIDFIKKKHKNIVVSNKLSDFDMKFDTIFMFHVLEHIPSQVQTLKTLNEKLKKNGTIIIEVPSAQDFLLTLDILPEFKKFTFWSEHLVLHTEKSLKKILKISGFRKIKIIHFQRYNLNNHLYWFTKKKPGGHFNLNNTFSKSMLTDYNSFLIKNKCTDTLIAIAKK